MVMTAFSKLGKKLLNIRWWVKALLIALITTPIAVFITWFSDLFVSISTMFSALIGGLIAIIFFMFAMYYRKGNESFVETIPYIILAGVVAGLVVSLIPALNGIFSINVLNISGIFSGLAIIIGSTFMSEAIVSRFM